jgi:pimeloyl-ACP methyl ester carboxylesterase
VEPTRVTTPDGRALGVYDVGPTGSRDELVAVWHHGTPQIGAPPDPLLEPGAKRGIRWVGIDRPAYGASTANTGRDVASFAGDVGAVMDALGIERFATLGASGGGPHVLACGALLTDRVVAAVTFAGLAPYAADGLDWYAGMHPASEGELRAAASGREALVQHLQTTEFDPEMFSAEDHAALAGEWGWLGAAAEAGTRNGLDGIVDDDLAFVGLWGFAPVDVAVPTLIVHGEQDGVVPHAHGEWLAHHLPTAELWSRPADGHVSVLRSAEAALDWVVDLARRA